MPVTRVGGQDIRDGGITDADVAPANKDGLPAVPSLRTLGAGPQQAAAGDDPRLAYPDSHFRHSHASSSPPGPRYYVAGKISAGGGTTSNVTKDLAYFMPFRTGAGVTLTAVGVANTTAPGPAQVNLALFDSIGEQDLHPNNRIAEMGTVSLNSVGPPFILQPLAVALPPSSLYWLAVVFGGTGPNIQCRTLPITIAEPILGQGPSLSGDGGIGYTLPLPVGPFPATVSPASTTPITGNGTPFIVYGV